MGSFGFLSVRSRGQSQDRGWSASEQHRQEMRSLTGMVDDGELPVGLFDLELGGRRRDAEDVVVGGVGHHGGEGSGRAMRCEAVCT